MKGTVFNQSSQVHLRGISETTPVTGMFEKRIISRINGSSCKSSLNFIYITFPRTFTQPYSIYSLTPVFPSNHPSEMCVSVLVIFVSQFRRMQVCFYTNSAHSANVVMHTHTHTHTRLCQACCLFPSLRCSFVSPCSFSLALCPFP